VPFSFAGHSLDIDRRELRRGSELIPVEPQVFDLLVYLLRNRDRVVSKDDLIASFDWHAVATLATWMMTLFITRSSHRDTQAIEAKLDELLRVHGDARNELIELDDREPEEIEEHRQRERRAL
jgi:hypothetical protein